MKNTQKRRDWSRDWKFPVATLFVWFSLVQFTHRHICIITQQNLCFNASVTINKTCLSYFTTSVLHHCSVIFRDNVSMNSVSKKMSLCLRFFQLLLRCL